MTKREHAAATLLGLLFAGGTVLAAGSASASVAAGQRLTTSNGTTAVVTGSPERPRCHWVRGRWRWDRRRGHRVWVPRHRVCR
jgi:hypothetical protein